MPTVPRLANTQVAPTALQAPNQTFVPNETLTTLGQGIQRVSEIGAQLAVNQRNLQIRSMANEATSELENFELGLETDQDFDSQPERYRAKVAEVLGRFDESVQDQRTRSLFRAEMATTIARQEYNIRKNALKGAIGVQRALTDQTLLDLAKQAGTGDPAIDDEVKAKGLRTLDDAFVAGVISAEELQKKAAQFQSDTTAAAVRRQILDDPEAAERSLLEGGYEGLSGEDRTVWIERAGSRVDAQRRERLAAEERAYRLAEREAKETADATAKDGDRLVASGGLTSGWIEQNRDNLSPEDFRYFYGKLTGRDEDAETNSVLYAELRDRAGRGEDVRDEARVALINREIKASDFDRITSEVEQQRPGWFKRGLDYISTSAGVSDLNPDPSAAQRKADMLDDWSAWADQNKDATQEQARTAYRNIVEEYAIIDRQQMTITFRSPRYLVGTRNQPDLDSTEAATVEAFQNGEIDREEFERQAELLQKWRSTLTIQP